MGRSFAFILIAFLAFSYTPTETNADNSYTRMMKENQEQIDSNPGWHADYSEYSPSKPPSDIVKWILIGIGGGLSSCLIWAVIKNVPVIRVFAALAFCGLGVLFLVGLFNANERKDFLRLVGWKYSISTHSNSNSVDPNIAHQLRRLRHLKEKARSSEQNWNYFNYLIEKESNHEQFTAKEAEDFSVLLEVFSDER